MRQPPTATATFLFTDIEGSTRPWVEHPDAMRPALTRHDHLQCRVIEASATQARKPVGGDRFDARPAAPDALGAAGRAMTPEQAVGYAQADEDGHEPH